VKAKHNLILVMPLPMGFMQSKNQFKNQSGVLYVFHKARHGHYQNKGAQGKS